MIQLTKLNVREILDIKNCPICNRALKNLNCHISDHHFTTWHLNRGYTISFVEKDIVFRSSWDDNQTTLVRRYNFINPIYIEDSFWVPDEKLFKSINRLFNILAFL